MIHGVPQQNVPEDYIKGAVWKTDVIPNRYHAQSSAPEESGIPAWYPVEFNPEHICWVEVRWIEPAGREGYWQAFRIAGEDLGLDITQEEVEGHIERTSGINNYRESIASSPQPTLAPHQSRVSLGPDLLRINQEATIKKSHRR
jgi:hypothetical protein